MRCEGRTTPAEAKTRQAIRAIALNRFEAFLKLVVLHAGGRNGLWSDILFGKRDVSEEYTHLTSHFLFFRSAAHPITVLLDISCGRSTDRQVPSQAQQEMHILIFFDMLALFELRLCAAV